MKNNDIFFYYCGGSGGFIALHGILISGMHYAYPYGNDALSVVNRQWDSIPIDDISAKWRDSEIWPDNDKTRLNDGTNLYFNCNPTVPKFGTVDNEWAYLRDTTKVVVYTDIDTQHKLMQYKKAHIYMTGWFPSFWSQFYDNIRLDTWGDCEFPSDIRLLPIDIQNTIYSYAEYMVFFGKDSSSELDMVEKATQYYRDKSDYAFKIQDVVKSKFRVITDALGLPYKDEHSVVMDKWLSLHPKDLQEILLS